MPALAGGWSGSSDTFRPSVFNPLGLGSSSPVLVRQWAKLICPTAPRVSEAHSWTIDETAEMGSRLDEPLLDDPRIFMLAELQPDATKAAWDLPPPQPLR